MADTEVWLSLMVWLVTVARSLTEVAESDVLPIVECCRGGGVDGGVASSRGGRG